MMFEQMQIPWMVGFFITLAVLILGVLSWKWSDEDFPNMLFKGVLANLTGFGLVILAYAIRNGL